MAVPLSFHGQAKEVTSLLQELVETYADEPQRFLLPSGDVSQDIRSKLKQLFDLSE